MNRKQTALVCAPLVPEHDRESGSRRIFHLIELLQEAGWGVAFIAQHSRGEEDVRYRKALQQRGVLTFIGMDSDVEEFLVASRFDIAIVAFWYFAEQIIPILRRVAPGTRIIVDSIDLHFLREARESFRAIAQNGKSERMLPAATLGSEATIAAQPNPVPECFGPGRTQITWNTGGAQCGYVYVSVNRGGEKLFAEGASGAADATWISDGCVYEFRLYAARTRNPLLAAVTVMMERSTMRLGPVYGAKMVGEVNAYASADAVLTVSPKEASLINDLVGDSRLAHAVPDFDDLNASMIPWRERRGILFVGNFKHAPNVAAMEYLCRDIAPKLEPSLLAKHPLYIIGNALDENVREFAKNAPGIRMVGWVPSVAPYLEHTRISVVPLTYGAGTKRKLLHALLVGSPAVSTSVGIEGLGLQHGEQVLVADTPEAFAEAITRLLSDTRLWKKLARQGRAYALSAHGREGTQKRLLEVIRDVLERSPKKIVRSSPPPNSSSMIRRLPPQKYQSLIVRIRDAVRQTLPKRATIIVVSKGDDQLLQLDGRQGWHFPRTADGQYAGYHPTDSRAAVEEMESLRKQGADFLLLPQTAFWWLDHYAEFKQHLDQHYTIALRQDDACIIYALHKRIDQQTTNSDIVSQTTAANQESAPKPARLIAFYLPQFYPIPENNAWWGDGFTEWTNVCSAQPLFKGHDQPHLPGSLGFYDLRVSEVREAQANMARAHGVEAFCYWHYWFHGKQLLERPLNEVLLTGEPDFPFCLAWANETWSRRWHGTGNTPEVLQAQTYSAEDDREHARWLTQAFADRRYLKVNSRPIFLIYRPTDLPAPRRFIDILCDECARRGLHVPYLIGSNSHKDVDYRTLGFDATLEFEPQLGLLSGYTDEGLKIYNYVEARERMTSRQRSFPIHPCIFVRWDNTPRRGKNGIVFTDATPAHFETGLRQLVQGVQNQPADERLIWVNAWNEWAEGNHLEPDIKHGLAYLEATKRALRIHHETPCNHAKVKR